MASLSDGADAVPPYPPPPRERREGAGGRQFGKFEGVVAIAGLAVAWQIASYFFPNYLFPTVPAIAERFLEIFSSLDTTLDAFATGGRILLGLAGAFFLGGILAALMARSLLFERYAFPLLSFNQGIPALSWVVIAIIWFKGIEFRIFFIMVMTTLPGFTFQLLDAYRSMSNDLYEMTLSFRPSRYDLLRTLIWPAVLPGILRRRGRRIGVDRMLSIALFPAAGLHGDIGRVGIGIACAVHWIIPIGLAGTAATAVLLASEAAVAAEQARLVVADRPRDVRPRHRSGNFGASDIDVVAVVRGLMHLLDGVLHEIVEPRRHHELVILVGDRAAAARFGVVAIAYDLPLGVGYDGALVACIAIVCPDFRLAGVGIVCRRRVMFHQTGPGAFLGVLVHCYDAGCFVYVGHYYRTVVVVLFAYRMVPVAVAARPVGYPFLLAAGLAGNLLAQHPLEHVVARIVAARGGAALLRLLRMAIGVERS